MISPVHQFEIRPLIPIWFGNLNVSFSNSALVMLLAILAIYFFLARGIRDRSLVPGKWQSLVEILYGFVANMIRENIGKDGEKYFPFIFTLFAFVLGGNFIGMLPYSFAYTSHIIVTGALAIVVFTGVTVIGFVRHGLHFLRLFFPQGAPWAAAPILIPIELLSYLSRPFSLSVRLFANVAVGHIMLKVLAGFVVSLGLLLGVFPLAATVGVTILEFGISFLQAYVFAILSCIYLNDALYMH